MAQFHIGSKVNSSGIKYYYHQTPQDIEYFSDIVGELFFMINVELFSLFILLIYTSSETRFHSSPENGSSFISWNIFFKNNNNAFMNELSLDEGSEILYLLSEMGGNFYEKRPVALQYVRKLQSIRKLSSRLRHPIRNHKNISALSPFSLISTNSAENSSSLHVNWHLKIGRADGFLNIPTIQRVVNGREQNFELLVDIGLETGSGLVCELFENKNYVLIGIEANIVNFGVSYRNILFGNTVGDPHVDLIKDRVLLLPLGVSNQTGMTVLNENYKTGCGSILESRPNGWWCTHTINSFHIPAVRLDFLLDRVPSHYNFLFLKIDVEGADLLVVQGAGSYISKFEMVNMECKPPGDIGGELGRYGACSRPHALSYMLDRGFKYSVCIEENCLFWKRPEHNTTIRRLSAVAERDDGYTVNDCPYNVNLRKQEEELQKQKEKERLRKEGGREG